MIKLKYYDGIKDYSHLTSEEIDEYLEWSKVNPPDE